MGLVLARVRFLLSFPQARGHAVIARSQQSGQWTVPSTIGAERATNPFLRVHEARVQEYTSRKGL